MPSRMGIPLDDLEVVGHRGTPAIVCADSVPIVRHISANQACALLDDRPPVWDPWDVIVTHAAAGSVTLFPRPVPFPGSFADTDGSPAKELVVLGASQAFLAEIARSLRGKPPESWAAVGWTTWLPGGGGIYLCDAAEAERRMNDWSERLIHLAEEQLGRPDEDWAGVERVAEYATATARREGLRYAAWVRYLASFYFRPGDPPIRTKRLFGLYVEKPFAVTWEHFVADVAHVREVALARGADAVLVDATAEVRRIWDRAAAGLIEQASDAAREVRRARDERVKQVQMRSSVDRKKPLMVTGKT